MVQSTYQLYEDFRHLNAYLPNMHMTSVKNAVLVLKMHCAVSNFVDYFSGVCIIVLIETMGIYVIHCLLPSYHEVSLS